MITDLAGYAGIAERLGDRVVLVLAEYREVVSAVCLECEIRAQHQQEILAHLPAAGGYGPLWLCLRTPRPPLPGDQAVAVDTPTPSQRAAPRADKPLSPARIVRIDKSLE
jgi:hypothetical protein